MISRRLIFRSGFVGVITGIILCASLWAYHFFNGAVYTGKPLQNPLADATATPKPFAMSGVNFTLDYPASFDKLARLAVSPPQLENYSLSSSTQHMTMSIDVETLASGNLEDDSSWRSRELKADQYQKNFATLENERVGVMTKNDSSEKTLFWAHGGKLLIVALTTANTEDDLGATLGQIQTTIRWRS